MAMAYQQEGPFKPMDSTVSTLSKLERCDLLLLLCIMRVPLSRADGMGDSHRQT